jgi:hypothetical protein
MAQMVATLPVSPGHFQVTATTFSGWDKPQTQSSHKLTLVF